MLRTLPYQRPVVTDLQNTNPTKLRTKTGASGIGIFFTAEKKKKAAPYFEIVQEHFSRCALATLYIPSAAAADEVNTQTKRAWAYATHFLSLAHNQDTRGNSAIRKNEMREMDAHERSHKISKKSAVCAATQKAKSKKLISQQTLGAHGARAKSIPQTHPHRRYGTWSRQASMGLCSQIRS